MSTIVETFERTSPDSEHHRTLYYYDLAGNLVKTVPPKGVAAFDDATAVTIPSARSSYSGFSTASLPSHTMATRYQYNTLNQLVWQDTPDGGETTFYYDELGRLILSQNARQLTDNQFSYTLYDALGRIQEAGELTPSSDIESWGAYQATGFSNQYFYLNFEDWVVANMNTKEEVVQTHYDASMAGIGAEFNASEQENLRNRVASVTYDLDGDAIYESASHYSYDIHGNVQEYLQENTYLNDLEQDFKRVTYDYDLISGNVKQVDYQKGEVDAFHHRYSYDADNRIVLAETSSEETIWDRDAKYFYYDHGPLGRTEIGHHKVQGADHAYTVQGWLKGVNSNILHSDRDMGQDAEFSTGNLNSYVGKDEFGYSLGYFQGDYTAKGDNASDLLASLNTQVLSTDLFNGNIKHMATGISHFDETAQVMQYKYDQLNRLKTANSIDASHNGTNWLQNSSSDKYRVELTYDANGNILSLDRRDEIGALFDELGYTYDDAETNQLSEVEDNPSEACDEFRNTSTYSYDEIGNLISETNNTLQTDITWSVTGKILTVTRNAVEDCPNNYPSDLEFRYDPMGNRIMKIEKTKDGQGALNPTNQWNRTYYARDPQGNVMAVYERDQDAIYVNPAGPDGLLDKLVVAEHNIYGSSRVGIKNSNKAVTGLAYAIENTADFMVPEAIDPLDPITRSLGMKQYELSNHLGNVLVTVSDRKIVGENEGETVTKYRAEVLFASDYYPFGMQMPGRIDDVLSKYRYGFNGMEKDDEFKGEGNSYDFGARMYDSRIGRWLSVDPLAANYVDLTPYCFVGNRPIIAIDPDGKEIVIVGADGTKTVYTPQMKISDDLDTFTALAIMSLDYIHNQVETGEDKVGFLVANNSTFTIKEGVLSNFYDDSNLIR